jgi:hypothetical protein
MIDLPEGDNGDKAKCKPRISFDDPRRIIALLRDISYNILSFGRYDAGLTQLWH